MTERSADETVSVVVELSFSEFGSFEAAPVAVLLTVVPDAMLSGSCTTSVYRIAAPAASVPMLQFTVPFVPGSGVVQPTFGLRETNVVGDGKTSWSVTLFAALGPSFTTEIVYVTFIPGAAAAGPVFVTATSARGIGTSVPTVEESFSGLSSGVLPVTVAVLRKSVPSGVPLGM